MKEVKTVACKEGRKKGREKVGRLEGKKELLKEGRVKL